MRIALVTEEFHPRGGGIGTAFYELAAFLSRTGHEVSVYLPDAHVEPRVAAVCEQIDVKLVPVPVHRHSWRNDAPGRSWAFYCALRADDRGFDVVHFHEYFGSAFFSLKAKQQSLAFSTTSLVVQMHGPSDWALEMNGALPRNDEDLKIAYLERWTVENADLVHAPSRYIADWAKSSGWRLRDVRVIPNLCGEFAHHWSGRPPRDGSVPGIADLVFLGRQEERKGLRVLLAAVARLAKKYQVRMHILGPFGEIGHLHSGLYLIDWAKRSGVQVRVQPGFSRSEAFRYIWRLPNPLVIVPSAAENSPYTVLEPALASLPVVFSRRGGAQELFEPGAELDSYTFDGDRRGALEAVLDTLLSGRASNLPKLVNSVEALEAQWASLHEELDKASASSEDDSTPAPVDAAATVALGIVHYERPSGLMDAVKSALMQSRMPDEIIVVDDGSRSPEALAALDSVETLLTRSSLGRVIRQSNQYLGAARNTAINSASSDYIVFLDDDNLLLPRAIEVLLQSATATSAAATAAVCMFLPADERVQALADLPAYQEPVSFLPLGGPLSLGLVENVFGDATGIYRLDLLKKLDGYTEIYGVGYEDYELYLRIAALGEKLEVCPEIVYLYQTGQTSMLTETSAVSNQRRVVEAVRSVNNDILGRAQFELYARTAGEHSLGEARGRARWLAAKQFDPVLIEALDPWQTPSAEAVELLRGHVDEAFVTFDGAPHSTPGDTAGPREVAAFTRQPHKSALVTSRDELIMRAAASRDDREELAEILQHVRGQMERNRNSDPSLGALEVILLLRLDEPQPARAAFRQHLEHDEADYRSRYEDVAAQIDARVFPSGLRHYRTYGRDEGRQGFSFVHAFEQLAASLGTPSASQVLSDAERTSNWTARLTAPIKPRKSG